MKAWKMAAVGIVSAVLAGCGPNKPAPVGTIQPVSLSVVQSVRHSYQQADSSSRVGYVVAVLPNSNLMAVADIPVQDVPVGTVVTFLAQDRTVLGDGTVVAKMADTLHVRCDRIHAQRRIPAVGDLGVVFLPNHKAQTPNRK